eukprot:COSAG02_NODE_4312_length_5520_cov_4.593658_6_plen_90_part_00
MSDSICWCMVRRPPCSSIARDRAQRRAGTQRRPSSVSARARDVYDGPSQAWGEIWEIAPQSIVWQHALPACAPRSAIYMQWPRLLWVQQ